MPEQSKQNSTHPRRSPAADELGVALVTGGSRGIGRAICLELAAHGATVVVNYAHRREAAETCVAEIQAEGGRALALQADVSDPEACLGLVRSTIAEFGRLDVLVCNAGVLRVGLAGAARDEDWQQVVDTNLNGSFWCVRAAIPQFLQQRAGSIVCMSSRSASRGERGMSAYAASKAALEGMVRSLAVELARKGVRINAVAPGFVRSDMTEAMAPELLRRARTHIPMARVAEPEEVARVVRFIASKSASYVTGEVIGVHGGLLV